MSYVFFGPRDLREVDPRPAPSMDAAEATVTRMLEQRFVGDDLTRTMQALGLLPYERMLNPNGRDAWAQVKPTVTDNGRCKNGHVREAHTYVTSAGVLRCRECRRISESTRRVRQRESKAA